MSDGRRIAILLACIVVFFVPALGAQQAIGVIDETDNIVQLDAFGTGRFVRALKGDVLYEQSVISTDYESWAFITIDGNPHIIGPNSETPVRSFQSTRKRGIAGFFSRLIRGISDSLAPPDEEEEVLLGGRASNIAESTGSDWVFDVDLDEQFAIAEAALADSDYATAVDALRLIEYPEDGSFELEDYYVMLAHALMGLGDFHAAMSGAFEYFYADPDPSNVAELPERLQLLAGISAFYAGEDEISRESLRSYIDAVGVADAPAEAIAALVRLLRESGENATADELLDEARAKHPHEDWNLLLQG